MRPIDEIVYEGTVKHNETGTGGKLGIWLDRKRDGTLRRLLDAITPSMFDFRSHLITIPAEFSKVGDCRIGDRVRVTVQKPDLEDLVAQEEGGPQ